MPPEADVKGAIRALVQGHDLDHDAMRALMMAVMQGEATPAQVAGVLVALRMKGETVTEIAAAAEVMRELVIPVHAGEVVDIVGTGGDGANTYNVSTAAALVVAAAGGRVAKHGNRSVSSSSGSADVLEACGVRLDLTPEQIAGTIDALGIGFMFAPRHHAAMRHAVGPRRDLGIRTLFNLLGPLTNPAGARRQLVGVFAARWVRPVAEALGRLGSEHAMVVHGADGMDEVSLCAPTQVCELRGGEVHEYEIAPEDFGIQRAPLTAIAVDGVEASRQRLLEVLGGKPGPAADIARLNAGAALYVAGLAPDLPAGIARATEVLASGAARERLEALARHTRELS